jgi:hypothetical protein
MVCLSGALVLGSAESLYLRHQRAYQRWIQRQPTHYRYQVKIDSPLLYLHYLVTMRDGQMVQVSNMLSGSAVNLEPRTSHTYMPGYYLVANHLLIDSLFYQIRESTGPPRSVKSFLGRSSPTLYSSLVTAGWLPEGWQGCQPAFPEVHYNPTYGYPEQLYLFGHPCESSDELQVPVKISISDFQVLP